MAVIAEIADAVVAELNATAFSQSLVATRSYLPRFDLAEMKELRVTVVPKGVTILPGARRMSGSRKTSPASRMTAHQPVLPASPAAFWIVFRTNGRSTARHRPPS